MQRPILRAVALLSGGMDSTTAAAIAQTEDGCEVHALAVDYGQRARVELDAARRVAEALGLASFRTVAVDLRALGGSALTDEIDVPKDRPHAEIGAGVPVTYVPARNTVFLALALAAAEVLDAGAIYLGVNALDTSGYPDCRPDFLAAMQDVARTGTKQGAEGHAVELRAPLMELDKAGIVRRGVELDVPFLHTLSCYDPVQAGDGSVAHCRRCDACRLRARGFKGAQVADPAP